jgi:drug/metabolite transporter (DMT)-like permease
MVHLANSIMMFAASLGFLLNLLAFAVIKLTGSLTQKVLGTVKNVLLVVFQFLFMGESITWRQWIGYQVSLLGFAWYQQQKMAAAATKAELKVASPPRSPRSPSLPKRDKWYS